MLKNFFKTGYRNIKKDKILSFVLIISLVVGLTSFSLIAIYLDFNFSYDKYHNDANKIYRIITRHVKDDKNYEVSLGAYRDILERTPGVQASTKLFFFEGPLQVKIDEKKLEIESLYFADSGFFKVFTHKFIAGEPANSLTAPNDVIITKKYAMNFWGKTDVVGKRLNCLGLDLYVKGVIEDVPYNSHFRFDMLLPFSSAPKLFVGLGGNEYYTYLRIKKESDDNAVLAISKTECMNEYSKLEKYNFPKVDLIFQPLLDIHLNSENNDFSISGTGNKSQIKTLIVIAVSILIILIMNFVNLLSVKFQKRLKEVGIRKILGGNNLRLLFQFTSEPVIISFLAAVISIILVFLFLDSFGNFFNLNLSSYFKNPFFIIVLILVFGFFIGIISAIFPIYRIINSNNPSEILVEEKSLKRRKLMFSVVVIQLAVVVGMIVMVLITTDQIKFLRNKDLGFNKDRILTIDNNGGVSLAAVMAELEKVPGVIRATASQTLPGHAHSGMTLGNIGAPAGTDFSVSENRIQRNFISVYGLNLIAGRDFKGNNEEEQDNIIINETAAKLLGFTPETIINQKVNHFNGIKTVIGIVKDFHFTSLRSKIEPLVLSNYSPRISYYSVSINTDNYPLLLKNIEYAFKSINPNYAFKYSFLSEDWRRLYVVDEKEASFILYMTIICIALSLVGLIALTSYTVIRRSKEIGIRKVFGASTNKILLILLKDYLKLIILSNIIILPIIEMFVSNWLNNYAYHVGITVTYFLEAFLISLVLTLSTVFYFTLKGSMKNPVETFRCG
jgi:putative ABC transport system permease protein